jgi:hypothetical protein
MPSRLTLDLTRIAFSVRLSVSAEDFFSVRVSVSLEMIGLRPIWVVGRGVRQLTVNQRLAGSTPAPPTIAAGDAL